MDGRAVPPVAGAGLYYRMRPIRTGVFMQLTAVYRKVAEGYVGFV